MTRLRIGFISQWYPPEKGAGALPRTIAHALRDLGHDVTVLTGVPNYPTGKVYPGYSVRRYQCEEMDGIPVHRVALYPSHDRSPLHRTLNYLSFAATGSVYVNRALANVDVALVYSSPITAALPAIRLMRTRRVPYVLLVQDMWPQSVRSGTLLSPNAAALVETLLHRLCDGIYRRAACAAVTSPGMAHLIARRIGDAIPIVFAPNWVDEALFHPAERSAELARRLGIAAEFVVMYAGNIGEMQGLDIVLDAASQLSSRRHVEFVLVGSGTAVPRLKAAARSRDLTNVLFIDPQPLDDMAAVLALGDVQLVALRDEPIFRHTLPSKLQASLASGRPLIAAVVGDAADLIARSGAGVVVDPGSGASLAAAVQNLAARPASELVELGIRGRNYYTYELSQAVGAARLADLLASVGTRATT